MSFHRSAAARSHGTARAASHRRAAVTLAGAALTIAALAGCGSSSTGASAPTSSSSSSTSSTAPAPSSAGATGGSSVVTIKDFRFMPPASVPAGSTVKVKNEDSTSHTVTASGNGGFTVTVAGNSTGTFTAPAKAGSYPYVCSFHGNMSGVLKVV